MMRSDRSRMAFITCSITIRVIPWPRIRLMRPTAASISAGLSPAMTSSRRSTVGRMASARASSMRLRSGTLRPSAAVCARWASETKSSTSSARQRASARERAPPRAPNKAPTITFSMTVRLRKGLTIWKVRLTPRRPMACGERPRIEPPRKRTSPAVHGRAPVTRLTRVVLPEPLGPMSPRISPSWRSKLTSDTAASPPNRLVTPRASTRAIGLHPVLAQIPGELAPREFTPADDVGQSLGHEEHDEDHHDAVEELGQAYELGGEELGDGGEHERAEERAHHRAHAAEHGHDDHLDRDDDFEDSLGVDEGDPVGEHTSHEPGEGAGEREGGGLVEGGVDAHGHGGILVLADGHEAVTEARSGEPPVDGGGREQNAEHQVEERQGALRDGHRQPGAAAGDLEVVDDLAHRLGHSEGGDSKVVPLEPQDGNAHEGREDHGGEPRRGQGESERPFEHREEHARGVGADAKEGHVSEGGVASEAADDVPALCERGQHEEIDEELRQERRERDGSHDESQHHEHAGGDGGPPGGDHLSSSGPRCPWGARSG